MKKWTKSVAIRTVKTMAQAAIGVIGSTALFQEVNWHVVVSTVALAGLTCILMNISQIEIEEE